jgi:hypothetical protein
MRAGNFAGLSTLIDPLSGSPFPSNQIPSNRIDSRATTLVNKIPLPNAPGTSGGTLNNYITNIKNDSDINRYFVKVDHRLTDKDNLSFTGNISIANPYFVAQAFPDGYGSWENGGNDTRVANFTWNHNVSATVLNEMRGRLYLSRSGAAGHEPRLRSPHDLPRPVRSAADWRLSHFQLRQLHVDRRLRRERTRQAVHAAVHR